MVLCLVASQLDAATDAVVDLGEAVTITTQVKPGVVTIKVINMVFGKRSEYGVTSKIEETIADPVSLTGTKPAPTTPIASAILTDPCDQYAAAIAAVKVATTEKAVATESASLRTEDAAKCPKVRALLSEIDLDLGTVDLARGQMLVVTVTRTTVEKTWVRRFATGKRGEWLTSYGLYFVPNRDNDYSSYALGNNEFEIRRSRDRERLDYIASLTFSYMRQEDVASDRYWAPAFGLGYDLSSISGSAGLAWIFNHNFTLSAGVMIHQQRRLKGQYEEDQHITGQPIDNNGLTEKTWAPNVYVGLSIRSLTSPFR